MTLAGLAAHLSTFQAQSAVVVDAAEAAKASAEPSLSIENVRLDPASVAAAVADFHLKSMAALGNQGIGSAGESMDFSAMTDLYEQALAAGKTGTVSPLGIPLNEMAMRFQPQLA